MRRSGQIAGVYVGSVIGAGFSSGQELNFFFAQYGVAGYVAYAAAVGVFVLGGMYVVGRAQRWGTVSHAEWLQQALGSFGAVCIDYALTAFAFIVLAIMLAAAGSLGAALYRIPFSYGIWGMAIISREILRGDTERFLRFNGVFVTVLLLLTVVIVAPLAWSTTATETYPTYPSVNGLAHWHHFWRGAALYPAYNVVLALPALAGLGVYIQSPRQAYAGAALGAAGLGAVGLLLLRALVARSGGTPASELPIVQLIASHTSVGMARLYGVALLLAIVTSCVSGAYGIGRRLERFNPHSPTPQTRQARRFRLTPSLPILAAPMAYVGFASLVQNVYPIIGSLGLTMGAAAAVTAIYRRIRP